MRLLYLKLAISIGLWCWASALRAQCDIEVSSSGGNASYTQVYVLVGADGNIVAENQTGTFSAVASGIYRAYALNYDPANPPNPLPSALIGQPVAQVGSVSAGCYNADFLTDYITRVCAHCAATRTFCQTDNIVITSSGAAAGYTQLYVLVDASSGVVAATNATGDFTGLVSSGKTYQVHALNYDPANPPSPLPQAGSQIYTTGSTAAGCYNSDFLSDYICLNINDCATNCFKSYNVCVGEDIIATASGYNTSYTQNYILADASGNFIAQNTTGTFNSAALTLGQTYRVYALNYDPANPPAPLPSALAAGAPLSSITGGCYNAEFLTDFVCITMGCPCDGKLVEYAPWQTVAGPPEVEYTRATAYCDESNGWRYYYSPSRPSELLFAIQHKPAGGNTNDFTAQVTLGVNDYSTSTGYDTPVAGQDYTNYEANFAMGRYWNVDVTSGSINGFVNVRFFYRPEEYTAANAAAADWRTTNEPAAIAAGFSGLAQLAPYWFKTNDASSYDPTPDVLPTNINNGNILVLMPNFNGTDALPIHNNKNYVEFDSQISSFSGGTVAFRVTPVDNILAIEGLQLQGQTLGAANHLTWHNINEINALSYQLERSTDGVNDFKPIGSPQAATQAAAYSQIDDLPSQNAYYRVGLLHADGSITYSNLVALQHRSIAESTFLIYPNPTDNQVVVQFESQIAQPVEVSVVDVLGRELLRKTWAIQAGPNRQMLDFSTYSAAVYMLTLKADNQVIIKKVIKQ